MEDSDLNAFTSVPDSQPFFSEEEENVITRRKKASTSCVEDSQSLIAPKRSRRHSAPNIKRNRINVRQIQKTRKQVQMESTMSSQDNEENECVLCNKNSNLKDFRNEYYGKLIASELEFVEPCMRTFVYVEILKLIHRNKYGHMPNDDMEIK